MSIQISEKHLSPKAKQALRNAKNKSQFMRDAMEYYVGNKIEQETVDAPCSIEIENEIKQIKDEIKEIKELLKCSNLKNKGLEINDNSKNDDIEDTKENTQKDIVQKEDGAVDKEKDGKPRDDGLDLVVVPDCYA